MENFWTEIVLDARKVRATAGTEGITQYTTQPRTLSGIVGPVRTRSPAVARAQVLATPVDNPELKDNETRTPPLICK